MILNVTTDKSSYPLHIERGVLSRAGELIRLRGRRICVVTDSGVPRPYVQTLLAQCECAFEFCFEAGEKNKNFDTYQALLSYLLEQGFDRSDAIVAVGGGVVSDLGGFAAATYMRGIDFYNIPTTLLSQVDASVGGKTAVDVGGYKNVVGAFWQPRAVLIDPETLTTLPQRRISDGLSEVIKMALTCDAALFERMEEASLLTTDAQGAYLLPDGMDDIIAAALAIKADVVAQDEREAGLRRVLNFGHTLGHAIESCSGLGDRYHGECVALGMLVMCSDGVRARLCRVLKKNGLPCSLDDLPSREALLGALGHDKKADGKSIHTVFVERVGEFTMPDATPEQLVERLEAVRLSMSQAGGEI